VWWAAAAVVLFALTRIAFGPARRSLGVAVTVWDDAVVRWLAGLHVPGLTGLMEAVVASIGSAGVIGVLRWGMLVALLVLRRFRHLLVFIGSFLAVLVVVRQATVDRPRPFGVELRGSWAGWAMPSRPVAILAVTLVGVLYTLVPVGRWRQLGKWVATGLVAAFAVARVHLGVDALPDPGTRRHTAGGRRVPRRLSQLSARARHWPVRPAPGPSPTRCCLPDP
jgi:hypothetical protein